MNSRTRIAVLEDDVSRLKHQLRDARYVLEDALNHIPINVPTEAIRARVQEELDKRPRLCYNSEVEESSEDDFED